MKSAYLALAILLVSGSAAWAQEKPQERPTLGPAPAPSLSGPHSSTTNDPRKLLRIRTLFVERIDNSLSEKLVEGLAKMARFRIVGTRNQADAVLRGTCFDSHRLKIVHSEVFLSDRTGGSSIWQDNVRRPFNPPPLEKAVNDTASDILAHLGESIREAESK